MMQNRGYLAEWKYSPTHKGKSAIFLAISFFNEPMDALLLLKKIAANKKARQAVTDEDQSSFVDVLFMNANADSDKTLSMLTYLDWPFNEKDANGQSIIHSAIKYNVSTDLISKLLQRAPDLVDMKNNIGDSPILLALHYNNLPLANFFYNHGCKLPNHDDDLNLSSISTGWLHQALLDERFKQSKPIESPEFFIKKRRI